MKRGALLGLGFIVGLANFIGGLGWCAVGTGSGSPLKGLSNPELFNVVIFLLTGPLAILPLCILGRKSPKIAALGLIAGGAFSAFWLLMVVLHDGVGLLFNSKPSLEAWGPLAAASVPMVVIGAAWLKGLQGKEK